MQTITQSDAGLDEVQKRFAAVAMETKLAVHGVVTEITKANATDDLLSARTAMAVIVGVASAAGSLAARLDAQLQGDDAYSMVAKQVGTTYAQEEAGIVAPALEGESAEEEDHPTDCPHCQDMRDAATDWSRDLFNRIMDRAAENKLPNGAVPATEMDPLLMGTADALGQVLGGIGAEEDVVGRVLSMVLSSREMALRGSVAGNA